MPTSVHPWSGEQIGFMPFPVNRTFRRDNYHLPVRVQVGPAPTAGRAAQASAHEIIAPHKTELLDDKIIRHIWHCPSCMALFESFPRFPKNARSVQEVMMNVDVFPPLTGT
jgi:hypothetical protein